MYRKRLLEILKDHPATLMGLAHQLHVDLKTLVGDVEHLSKSLRHGPERLVVEPAVCRKCGFTFDEKKIRKPSRCPHCKSTWIREPLVSVQ